MLCREISDINDICLIIPTDRKEKATMHSLCEHIQAPGWKSEKRVPGIEYPDIVNAEKLFNVPVTLGKVITHPNTTVPCNILHPP